MRFVDKPVDKPCKLCINIMAECGEVRGIFHMLVENAVDRLWEQWISQRTQRHRISVIHIERG